MDPALRPRREACNYSDRIGVIILIVTHINWMFHVMTCTKIRCSMVDSTTLFHKYSWFLAKFCVPKIFMVF